MSVGLPKRFSPERLAAQESTRGGTLTGTLDANSLPRLCEMLATRETAPVHVELSARRDDAKRLVLTGLASGKLSLTCQRCMEPVTLPVDANIALAVVRDEEAARNLPAELDPLLLDAGNEADLPALVEDELILALPPVPVHANVADCGERVRYAGNAGDDGEEHDGNAQRENPFAVLKKLKNGKD
ncbi:MAG TPA: YceD family protein [Gammaproteobacteria bacterium]